MDRTTQADFESFPPSLLSSDRSSALSTKVRPDSAGRIVPTRPFGVTVHAVLGRRGGEPADTVLEVLRAAADETVLVTFVNPATANLARRRADFAEHLKRFTLVLPDGIGMCLAMRLLHGMSAGRISFDMTSLAPVVLEYARRERKTVVLVGGAAGVAETAGGRMGERFPGLQVVGCFSGYWALDKTVQEIAALQPQIIICGMGAIRQESFLLTLRATGWRGWGFTCGGFFDQLQAGLTYYPGWIDRANLRWAYRLAREPRRLWRRYVLEYGMFALMVCAAFAHQTRNASRDA